MLMGMAAPAPDRPAVVRVWHSDLRKTLAQIAPGWVARGRRGGGAGDEGNGVRPAWHANWRRGGTDTDGAGPGQTGCGMQPSGC
jgi:hypothetical protein